ncbi:MAG: hypothetical protein F4106_04660 [Gemmatimonadetes bacterium]|nr:hypothetical protein [Gemmatimonadota bacterium]MYC91904.1 hypothetical protein [Gemmatimonadota bacterium]MYJ17326.1 hypothetical protein [Gemmatimonadota bacterium]
MLEAEDLPPVLGVLRVITREHPLLPVILVIEQGSPDLQRLASITVEAVLFRHQIVARLPAALKSSVGTTAGVRALAEAYIRNEAIAPSVRRLVTCALTAVPPPRTVQHLARLLNSDPSTVRRHWRRGVNSHGIQRVKDLLDWLVLLYAASVKRPHLSWQLVAERIGTHEKTLRRLAARLTGETLGSVGSAGPERLLRRFADSLAESFCAELP